MALTTIKGKVEDIVFRVSGNGNEFCTISFYEKRKDGSWNKYPYNCRSFDEEIIESLHGEVESRETGLEGVEGELRVEVKQDREYQGKTVTDRDIVDFNFTGKKMEWTRTQGREDDNLWVQQPPSSAGATYTGGGDPRQASIERQVAFKEAVANTLAIANLEGEGILSFRDSVTFWDAVNRATDIGESILNRTYINSPATASDDNADVKEPDDKQDQKELF
tara:strand:- start:59 stop:721 length:663 start_codon:yes stop_codon:yes gene_type:complete